MAEYAVTLPEVKIELAREKLSLRPSDEVKARLLNSIPFALGAEFVDDKWLEGIFSQLSDIFRREISAYDGPVAAYASGKRKDLKIPERVFFHLVENRNSTDYPFAFLATYATDEGGHVRHMPLSHALTEFRDDQKKLLQLLGCLNRAANVSPLLGDFVESGEMLHPLRLTSQEAYKILKTVPADRKSVV